MKKVIEVNNGHINIIFPHIYIIIIYWQNFYEIYFELLPCFTIINNDYPGTNHQVTINIAWLIFSISLTIDEADYFNYLKGD